MIAAAPPPIPVARTTQVRAYGGWLAFDRYDAAARGYHLTVRAPDGALRDLLPAVRGGYEFDLGPDARGRPAVIYSRCRADCDLYVRALAPRARERPVRAANTEADERAPTLWRGTVAWARQSRVYVKTPGHLPRRVGRVPRRRCAAYTFTRSCQTTTFREIGALELRGRRLAAEMSYLIPLPGSADPLDALREDEVRLVDVTSGAVRQVAEQEPGEGDEHWVGPSFDARHLAFYRSCDGQLGACGAYRYDLHTGRYSLAASGVPHRGFALTSAGAWVTPRRCLRLAGCAIRRVALSFKPACEPRRAALRRKRC